MRDSRDLVQSILQLVELLFDISYVWLNRQVRLVSCVKGESSDISVYIDQKWMGLDMANVEERIKKLEDLLKDLNQRHNNLSVRVTELDRAIAQIQAKLGLM